jgi:hypothetical protein
MGPFYRKLLAQETGRGSRKDNSLHCSSLAPFIIMLASLALGAVGVLTIIFACLAELAFNAFWGLALLVYDHVWIFWHSTAFFPL